MERGHNNLKSAWFGCRASSTGGTCHSTCRGACGKGPLSMFPPTADQDPRNAPNTVSCSSTSVEVWAMHLCHPKRYLVEEQPQAWQCAERHCIADTTGT